jgi:hypothetical protein
LARHNINIKWDVAVVASVPVECRWDAVIKDIVLQEVVIRIMHMIG